MARGKKKQQRHADDTFHDYRGWTYSEKTKAQIKWFGLPERDAVSILEAFPPTTGYERFDTEHSPITIPNGLKPTFIRATPQGTELIDVRWSANSASEDAISEFRDVVRAAGFLDFHIWTEEGIRFGHLVNNAEMVLFGARNPVDPSFDSDLIAALNALGGRATLAELTSAIGGRIEAYTAVCRLLLRNQIQLCDPAKLFDLASKVRIFDPAAPDPLAKALDDGRAKAAREKAVERAFTAATSERAPVFEGLDPADQQEIATRLFYIRNSEELISRYARLGCYTHSPNSRPINRKPADDGKPADDADEKRLRGYPRCAKVLSRLLRFQRARESKEARKRAAGKWRAGPQLPPYVFGPTDSPSGTTIRDWRRKYQSEGIMGLRRQIREDYASSIQDGRVLAIVKKHIDSYKQDERPPLSKIAAEVEADLYQLNKTGEGLTVPKREAIENFMKQELSPKDIVEGRDGKRAAREQYEGKREAPAPTRPFQIVEIDETPLDLFLVVLDDRGQIIDTFRPFFLAAIDKATRNVLAFWLGPERPNAATVGRVLRRAMLPKDVSDVEGATPIDLTGLIETLVIDNGSAFRARQLMLALEELRIRPQICRKGEGSLKGTIESLFKTYQSLLAVPGRTFSNPKERGAYNAQDAACLTYYEAIWIIKRWCVDIHHNSVPEYPPTSKTPAKMARELKEATSTPLIDPYRMASLLLTTKKVKVTPKGARYDSIFYDSDELREFHGKSWDDVEIDVKPDDDDLSCLVAILPNGPRLFLEKRSQEDVAGLTREELHERRAADAASNGKAEGYGALNEARLAIRERVERAKRRKRKGKEQEGLSPTDSLNSNGSEPEQAREWFEPGQPVGPSDAEASQPDPASTQPEADEPSGDSLFSWAGGDDNCDFNRR